jgi:hypothetical protein
LASESDPAKCEALIEKFVGSVVSRLYELERLWSPPGEDGEPPPKPKPPEPMAA